MELISLAGYAEEEKLHIATRYLIPRQLEENGLRPDAVSFEDNAIRRIVTESLDKNDLHVHVPAGAIPKDGPSAGVTMATAMVSALRNQPVRDDVAMTGEITLSGLVLPVGGIREKALAARRHGIKEFVLPARNEPDLAELPAEVKDGIRFIPVQTLEEVLKVALPER
ncbi:MAG: hypothetical protein DMG01_18000 [Acidobacteria bacterium]|nr:MAG: hypothetical protein DMG01_18000 [Acidobacteriota bacterium]